MVSSRIFGEFSDDNVLLSSEMARKTRLLRLFSLILLGLSILTEIYSIVMVFVRETLSLAPFLVLSIILLSLTSYYLAGKGYYYRASWILIGILMLVIGESSFQTGLYLPMTILTLLPISLAAVLLEPIATIVVTAICVISNITPMILQYLKVYTVVPSEETSLLATNVFLSLIIVPAVTALMVIPSRQQSRALRLQNEQLLAALHELEARQTTGQQVSERVRELSAELRVTASQQASGSQEQAASLMQVNGSITELSATAAQIAELARRVTNSTEAMAQGSREIEETTRLSTNQSEQGREAVKRTIVATQEVAQLYYGLQTNLGDLNDKGSNMRQILAILKAVAEETHLLALNASIEAVGAGQSGERFRVVAHEVKRLAERSQQAGQQVVEIIREIEAATLRSVEAVNTGYQKAVELEQVAGEAGTVIEKMREVSAQSQEQARLISQIAQEVRELSEVIQRGTQQQRTASEQVLSAVAGVSSVAHQNAEGSASIASTVKHLEEMSRDLTTNLKAA